MFLGLRVFCKLYPLSVFHSRLPQTFGWARNTRRCSARLRLRHTPAFALLTQVWFGPSTSGSLRSAQGQLSSPSAVAQRFFLPRWFAYGCGRYAP